MRSEFSKLIGRIPSGKRSTEYSALFTQLREAEINLKESATGLEAQFLATSSELVTLAELGGRFVQQVEKLVGLASGKDCDSTAFARTIHLVQDSTSFLVGCQEETIRMLGLLREYETQVKSLLGVENELQRAMMPLKVLQTLFKVESAPLGLAVQQMFSALTQEIEGLHAQVREIFGIKFKQLEQTHRTIGLVIAQLDKQACTLQQVTSVHKAQIESSLNTLKREIATNRERDVRLGRLSKDLAREVEQIVIGLQFQDIVNQKLQHVTAAIPKIDAKFAEFSAAPDAAAAVEPLQFLNQSSRLEAGQLQAAQKELAAAEAGIQAGVRKVLSNLTEMDSRCLSLEEFTLLTTSFDGMVQVLVDTIEEVRTLVAATVASAKEAYEMLRPLGSLASDLTAIVRSMSAQVHLIGLNAQVQAARAAQEHRGGGLEVLSARTSEISEEANRINEQAASRLDTLVAGLAESVKALGKLQAEGLAQQAVLDVQGRAEEQQLHAIRDDALKTLCEIGNSLDNIRKQALSTLDSVNFSGFHQVTLPGLREPLVAIADLAEQSLRDQGHGDSQINLIDGFKRDYTMESERAVYAGVMARNFVPPPMTEAAPRIDLEMFDELPAIPEGKPALPVTPTFENPSEAEVEVTVAGGGGNLGANIELF